METKITVEGRKGKKRNSIPVWGWILYSGAAKMSKKSVDLGAARWKIQTKLPEARMFGGTGPASPSSSQGHLGAWSWLFLTSIPKFSCESKEVSVLQANQLVPQRPRLGLEMPGFYAHIRQIPSYLQGRL